MDRHPHLLPGTIFTVALSLGFAMAWGLPTQVKAQSDPTLRGQTQQLETTTPVTFDPPSDEQADNSRGSASRHTEVKCSQDGVSRPPITALLPATNQGLTVATHPTFFVYVPPTSAQQAIFSFKDENNQGIYQTMFPIPKTGGIISLKLSKEKPPLEIGKSYKWSVGIVCQPTQIDIPSVQGRVRRIEPGELSTQLNNVGPLEQAALYGKAGVWYDTVAILAELVGEQPNDNNLSQNWSELLNSVGLEAIANKPLIQ